MAKFFFFHKSLFTIERKPTKTPFSATDWQLVSLVRARVQVRREDYSREQLVLCDQPLQINIRVKVTNC